jgi:hypothetical protein
MTISDSKEDLVVDPRRVRLMIGSLAFAFPVTMYALTGKIATSIGAYYHELATRDVFVGFLFIFGALLLAYKGHKRQTSVEELGTFHAWLKRHQEDWISSLGGIGAIIMALFPTVCDACSLNTTDRIHTIVFIMFCSVTYFCVIAFVRRLNIKLKAHDELRDIENNAIYGNDSLLEKIKYLLISDVLLFFRIVSEVSKRYDEGQPAQQDKRSSAYRRAKLTYLLSAYHQKIRRGFIYVICCSVIILLPLVSVLMALLPLTWVWYYWRLKFLIETIFLMFFGIAWMTASQFEFYGQFKAWLEKTAVVPERNMAESLAFGSLPGDNTTDAPPPPKKKRR